MNVYVPMIFLLGFLAREANWNGRTLGSGGKAIRLLQICVVVLLALKKNVHTKGDGYIRAIGITLMARTGFHRGVVGAGYAEEFCESMLSRFARHCVRHPGLVSVEHLSNLFVTLPNVKENITTRARGLPVGLRDKLTAALLTLVQSFIAHAPQHFITPKAYTIRRTVPLTAAYRWPPSDLALTTKEADAMMLHALKNITTEYTCSKDLIDALR